MSTPDANGSAAPVKRKAGRPRKADKEAAAAAAGLSFPSPAASTSGTAGVGAGGAGPGGRGRGRAARIAAEERQAAQLAAGEDSGAEERYYGQNQQQQSRAGSVDEQQAARGTKRAAPGDNAGGGNAAAGPSTQRARGERQKFNRKDLFEKDLRTMMYAFGDDPDPLPESVAVLEEIMVDYLSELCRAASLHSPNAKKLRLDDLRFALRKPQQRRQLARVEELLYAQEDIARARKNLDINSYGKDIERAF